MTKNNLNNLQEYLSYQFKNQLLLQTALTHRSCLNQPGVNQSYERLEFLGDAVLEMLISNYLYHKYPEKMEGFLTAARSATVRTESLSAISLSHQFDQYILMSKGEEASGGRQNLSILEDIIESLIGALYLDGGLTAAQNFFEKFIVPKAIEVLSHNQLKDPKSLLQERVQALGKTSPVYQTIGESGLDHNKTFEIAVYIEGSQLATGTGRNKQEAEQKAAQKALELL